MHDTPRLDWTQWIFPGPRRVFTDAELARAGANGWSPSIDLFVMTNALVLLLIFYSVLPASLGALVLIGGLVMAASGLLVARWLWRSPTRTGLNVASIAAGIVWSIGTLVAARMGMKPLLRELMPFVVGSLTLLLSSWWFLTIYRTQQIEGRLRELQAQQERLALGQRLATAQIQPHFLFNTLASLQHWVDTRDERAGPMLRSLTRYLRATLPMFEQDRLPLPQELQIVRSYLEVMQARLGQRLTWSLEQTEALPGTVAAASLPPGTLLTLAENAITHGIEPSLRGGHITVRVRDAAVGLRLEVEDGGQGLAPDSCEGLGLTNTRERLSAQFGTRARLGIEPGAAGAGCLAWVELPVVASAPAPAPVPMSTSAAAPAGAAVASAQSAAQGPGPERAAVPDPSTTSASSEAMTSSLTSRPAVRP